MGPRVPPAVPPQAAPDFLLMWPLFFLYFHVLKICSNSADVESVIDPIAVSRAVRAVEVKVKAAAKAGYCSFEATSLS